mmetsp:Transcript_6741/g.14718  ORF Transcript_6741/g.14718 Transcript_6741/m.14718 type:complete len:716 (+) Transcript_6741:260-2407(+)|eukprot:CAMPEP_0206431082 /NCGR_PEP_ID=MMETSP0324_2-20121206/7170_1 /ASSEMBLY_ACC=CAM_ASM_000836 /TAXON_ID=2866 /ORGANISM="Crypthecodinium cohnii, Strain Seligo" /LENGTH=715 /DNA_ID=CAMNT_0053896977 /DNA_START=185 /DNA_END=2332 /DNA_ORIENTATION=-
MRRSHRFLLSSAAAAATAAAAAAATTWNLEGVSKSDIEIVLAQFDEDLTWSDPYAHVRTVYCKGGFACSNEAIPLPNVGREGHTYLHHIVHNYDDLASWTVFSQAETPTQGYYHRSTGPGRTGHLATGVEFADYLTHHVNQDSKFIMTTQLHLPTLRHSLRSSFKASEKPSAGAAAAAAGGLVNASVSATAMCPRPRALEEGSPPSNGDDVWQAFQEVPQLASFLSKKCGLEEHVLSSAAMLFWEDYVQIPLPEGDILHYAQGARFAVSRDRIHQRSKEYYERLLEAMSSEEDPCVGYLLEWAWYYVIGLPSAPPCESGALETLLAPSASYRFLQNSGVSGGISGVVDQPNDAPATISETVAVTVISGSLGIELSDGDDADAFCQNQDVTSGFQETLADITGVPSQNIDVACSVDRRLLAAAAAAATAASAAAPRHLATSVTIGYDITVDKDTSSSMSTTPVGVTADSVQAAISSTSTSSFTSTLTSKLAAAGVTVVPTVSQISATTAADTSIVRTMTQTSSTQTTTSTTIPEVDWATIFLQAEASSQDVVIIGSLRVVLQEVDLCTASSVLRSIASYLAGHANLGSFLQVSMSCSTLSTTTSDGSLMTSTIEYTMTVTSESEAQVALVALFDLAGDPSAFVQAIEQYFQQAGYSAELDSVYWVEVADTARLTPETTTLNNATEENESDEAHILRPIHSAVAVLSSVLCLVDSLN